MSSKSIKAIVFDLGKVLVHFDFAPAYERFSKASGIAVDDIQDYFMESGIEVLYDGGKLNNRQFYAMVKQGLGHKVPYVKFQKIWNEIFWPNEEIVRILKRCKGKYRTVLLSNTNPMHFDYIWKKYPFMKNLDAIVLSYKEKCRKPDEKIYRIAARKAKARPAEILYIDDREDLTSAAKELGFNVFTYKKNIGELKAELERLGIEVS